MALRCLLRKLPALGPRSPAGPLMGPVHSPSPAAVYRHMTSYARTGSSPNKLAEFDQLMAGIKKAHRTRMATIRGDVDKWNKLSKALFYPVNAFSAFVILRRIM